MEGNPEGDPDATKLSQNGCPNPTDDDENYTCIPHYHNTESKHSWHWIIPIAQGFWEHERRTFSVWWPPPQCILSQELGMYLQPHWYGPRLHIETRVAPANPLQSSINPWGCEIWVLIVIVFVYAMMTWSSYFQSQNRTYIRWSNGNGYQKYSPTMKCRWEIHWPAHPEGKLKVRLYCHAGSWEDVGPTKLHQSLIRLSFMELLAVGFQWRRQQTSSMINRFQWHSIRCSGHWWKPVSALHFIRSCILVTRIFARPWKWDHPNNSLWITHKNVHMLWWSRPSCMCGAHPSFQSMLRILLCLEI